MVIFGGMVIAVKRKVSDVVSNVLIVVVGRKIFVGIFGVHGVRSVSNEGECVTGPRGAYDYLPLSGRADYKLNRDHAPYQDR